MSANHSIPMPCQPSRDNFGVYFTLSLFCPACEEPFVSPPGETAPVSLSCGHTICQLCAEALLVTLEPRCLTCSNVVSSEVIPNRAIVELLTAGSDIGDVLDCDWLQSLQSQSCFDVDVSPTTASTGVIDLTDDEPPVKKHCCAAIDVEHEANRAKLHKWAGRCEAEAFRLAAGADNIMVACARMIERKTISVLEFHAAVEAFVAVLRKKAQNAVEECERECAARVKALEAQADQLRVTCGQLQAAVHACKRELATDNPDTLKASMTILKRMTKLVSLGTDVTPCQKPFIQMYESLFSASDMVYDKMRSVRKFVTSIAVARSVDAAGWRVNGVPPGTPACSRDTNVVTVYRRPCKLHVSANNELGQSVELQPDDVKVVFGPECARVAPEVTVASEAWGASICLDIDERTPPLLAFSVTILGIPSHFVTMAVCDIQASPRVDAPLHCRNEAPRSISTMVDGKYTLVQLKSEYGFGPSRFALYGEITPDPTGISMNSSFTSKPVGPGVTAACLAARPLRPSPSDWYDSWNHNAYTRAVLAVKCPSLHEIALDGQVLATHLLPSVISDVRGIVHHRSDVMAISGVASSLKTEGASTVGTVHTGKGSLSETCGSPFSRLVPRQCVNVRDPGLSQAKPCVIIVKYPNTLLGTCASVTGRREVCTSMAFNPAGTVLVCGLTPQRSSSEPLPSFIAVFNLQGEKLNTFGSDVLQGDVLSLDFVTGNRLLALDGNKFMEFDGPGGPKLTRCWRLNDCADTVVSSSYRAFGIGNGSVVVAERAAVVVQGASHSLASYADVYPRKVDVPPPPEPPKEPDPPEDALCRQESQDTLCGDDHASDLDAADLFDVVFEEATQE